MWSLLLLLLARTLFVVANISQETDVYYYGIEESERSLPECGPRQACSLLVQRHWRNIQIEESERSLPECGPRQACSLLVQRHWRSAALLRLCRCDRRSPCAHRPRRHRLHLNNRAVFTFCQTTTDWPTCAYDQIAVVVDTSLERFDPDELEELHHKNQQLAPPKINFHCRCREPKAWQLEDIYGTKRSYRCRDLLQCKTGQFCGNVTYDLHLLYQSCLCPRNHICVHKGGVEHVVISELLYRGKGRQAFCQRVKEDSEDEYYFQY